MVNPSTKDQDIIEDVCTHYSGILGDEQQCSAASTGVMHNFGMRSRSTCSGLSSALLCIHEEGRTASPCLLVLTRPWQCLIGGQMPKLCCCSFDPGSWGRGGVGAKV
jgi:hypothetical protein